MRLFCFALALAAALALPAPAVCAPACPKQALSAEQAQDAVSRLSEVKAFMQTLSKAKGRPMLMVDAPADATAPCEAPEAHHRIYVGESQDTHTVRAMTFLVNAFSGTILFYDPLTDETLSLDQWRKTAPRPKE